MCEALLERMPPPAQLDADLCGCMWTAAYLDQTFFLGLPKSCLLFEDSRIPEGLLHPSVPAPVDGSQARAKSRDRPEMGIYWEIRVLLTVWSMTNTFFQDVRAGKVQDLWVRDSPYHRVQQALLNFEAGHSPCHRLENCKFESREPEDIKKDRMYWLAWLTQQVLYHTSSLLIHHPLVHTSAVSKPDIQVPPSFRQNAIDQTLLHAKWVVRLMRKALEKGLEPNDPFLAHLVGVSASALIFFMHASNERIRGEANRGFEKCLGYISSFSKRWAHIRHLVSAGYLSNGVSVV